MTDSPEPTRAVSPEHGIGKRNSRDRTARYVIFAGGMAMIASVVGIFLFLLYEVLPLLGGANVSAAQTQSTGVQDPRVVFANEHLSHLVQLSGDGRYVVLSTADGGVVLEGRFELEEGETITGVDQVPGARTLTASTSTGRVLLQKFRFLVRFEQTEGKKQNAVVTPKLADSRAIVVDPKRRSIRCYSVQLAGSGTTGVVAQFDDGTLRLSQRTVEVNQFTQEEEVSERAFETRPEGKLRQLLLTEDYTRVFGAVSGGRLVWWNVRGGEFGPIQYGVVSPGAQGSENSDVTALEFLLGGQSLLVGRENGEVSVWFPIRIAKDRNDYALTKIRKFPHLSGSIIAIGASRRNKGFLSLCSTGELAVCYSTTGELDWRGETDVPGAKAVAYSPKGDALLVAGSGVTTIHSLENEHPEVSLATLFRKVWYEGQPEPEYSWQSTGGTESYESKMSFVPLVIGTLKGTLFSMLLSIPIAVLGAMYVSQFMHFSLRKYIKPIIEIMAAIPSVVLGFLAAIWLAPKVEAFFTSLLLMGLVLPVAIVLVGFLWLRLPVAFRARFPDGIESVFFILTILVGATVCVLLGPLVETLFFGDNTLVEMIKKDTEQGGWGIPYEQRNAVVVGLAMSFAVIPIIFSISEDSFSNVPKNLVSGSLALGADRWQTVTKVVLPTASPGIFSATMIGFGRAVGETMIVLMATGNTAVTNFNPFTGFRALSANIAVEIPEAPQDGTLYRALFLSGVVLFAFTFFINTLAEVVRYRLRKRYATL